MPGFAPKKQFSQNFLNDPKAADAIVAALDIQVGDHVFEIGPGKGVLTQRLIATKAEKVTAIDLDPRSLAFLQSEPWAATPKLELIQGDALRQNLHTLWNTEDINKRKVIGNIPYGITSDILFWLFDACRDIHSAVILMQKEVAQRCVAQPRTKEYGILTLATWYAASAKIIRNIPPGAFFPKPKVTSSVVRITMHTTNVAGVAQAPFQKFVRAAFSQRRKVLTNSLHTWCSNVLGLTGKQASEALERQIASVRAEELSPEEMVELYQNLLALVHAKTV